MDRASNLTGNIYTANDKWRQAHRHCRLQCLSCVSDKWRHRSVHPSYVTQDRPQRSLVQSANVDGDAMPYALSLSVCLPPYEPDAVKPCELILPGIVQRFCVSIYSMDSITSLLASVKFSFYFNLETRHSLCLRRWFSHRLCLS